MKLKFLIQELKKWGKLLDKRTDAFIESIESKPTKHSYIREHILPVIDRDCQFQADVVEAEAKRLLKEHYERCKTKNKKETN